MHKKKKTNYELVRLLDTKIANGCYFFTNHSTQRLQERQLSHLDVLDILKGVPGKKRRRNKNKEKYVPKYQGWNYCIEGIDSNENKIRIIFSLVAEMIIVITVINLNSSR